MRNLLAATLTAPTLGLLMLGGADNTAHAAADQAARAITDPYVIVFDQKPQNNQVSITYAHLPIAGYVVVYGSDKDGNPTEPIGSAEVGAGSQTNVKVTLDKTPAAGSQLWVSLYGDRDQKKGFDKIADAPFWQDSLPKANTFRIE